MTALPNSTACFDHIKALHSQDIDLGLDRFVALLDKIGNPHQALPPVIHVAGTNGKGSTLAYLRSVFETAGWRVHSFTSPHFHRPHECITLNGEEISESLFTDCLNKIIVANDGAPLTVFEALTAAAFLAFSQSKAHIVLLETGMGGRGDTTNVIDRPLLTILTPITYDHQAFLGNDLSEIAHHKAGILKQTVPCISAAQTAEAYAIIRAEAQHKEVPLYHQNDQWFIKKAGDRLIFEGWQGDHAYPLPPHMVGDHQRQNAGVALAALHLLRDHYDLPDEVIRNGLLNTHWKGRLDLMPPLPDHPTLEIWVDGGHNQAAAIALAQHMRHWQDSPVYVIIGMLARKDYKAFITALAPQVTEAYCVPIADQDDTDPDFLKQAFTDQGTKATLCSDIYHALKTLSQNQEAPFARVLICGSLSMVAAYDILSERP